MRSDTLEAMLSTYKDELTQVRYAPEYQAKKREEKLKAVTTKIRKQLDDDALLKKLEGLTAPENPAPKKKAGTRRR